MKPAIALLLSMCSLISHADGLAPAMFTACPQTKALKTPANGAGVYFSSDCSTAYVLPPRLGKIVPEKPTRTSNARICTAYEVALGAVDAKSRKISKYIKELEKEEENISFGSLQDPWVSSGGKEPKEDLNPQLEELEKLRDQAMKSALDVADFNDRIATVEGPKITLSITADHDALVREYQKLNPKLLIRPMPVAKSVFTFLGRVDRNVGRAPAALYMDVNGTRVPANYLTGLKPEDETGEGKTNTSSILFSSAVAGHLVLSLVGACPFYNVRTGVFPEYIEAADLMSYIAPSIDYVYNVEVNRAYRARYNLAELFKRIQKQSTSGGFFTTKTLHSLVMERDSKGWFEFESLSQDPRLEWDDQLAQNVKAGLIARVLQRLGAKPIATSEVPGLIAPGKNGADTFSDGLKQCPHIYCQAGAYILQGLSAVFGSAQAVSEFINREDHWEEEIVKERKMVPQIGQTGFATR